MIPTQCATSIDTTFPELLFELSWEVCNKVGGIHTVITSKFSSTSRLVKKHILIGPYTSQSVLEFTAQTPPECYLEAIATLRAQGIIVHYGVWSSRPESPTVFLIECKDIYTQTPHIKRWYWDHYRIDSLRGYWDFEEPLIWAHSCGMFIEALLGTCFSTHIASTIVHAHEWLSGPALLYLHAKQVPIATIFTTHATVLGRCLASNHRDIYAELETIDPLRESFNYMIEAKHTTESAAANTATVFTTVSAITSREAEKFLGRAATIITPNGLELSQFPKARGLVERGLLNRKKLDEFIYAMQLPQRAYHPKQNKICYTLGRFEYHDKGYDVIIAALEKVNTLLKHAPSQFPFKTLTCFFWIPMAHDAIHPEVVKRLELFHNLFDSLAEKELLLKDALLNSSSVQSSEKVSSHPICEDYASTVRACIQDLPQASQPLLSTHAIPDSEHHAIIQALHMRGLINTPNNPVQIILMPFYLDEHDHVLNLSYYDCMSGCDLGIFPSYYEPWGYTPLESAALGIPAITTNVSGFGRFVESITYDRTLTIPPEQAGVIVLDRLHASFEALTLALAGTIITLLSEPDSQYYLRKVAARTTASSADWNLLITYYAQAYMRALQERKNVA